MPEKTAKMLRVDLKAANIPHVTPDGLGDFHSFRHSFVTWLATSNMPVKMAQTLARHSDPKLTLNVYAHVSPKQQADAPESAA